MCFYTFSVFSTFNTGISKLSSNMAFIHYFPIFLLNEHKNSIIKIFDKIAQKNCTKTIINLLLRFCNINEIDFNHLSSEPKRVT